MKVCLCGSTRFRDEFEAANRELSLMGYLVYSVACFMHAGDMVTAAEKEVLDLVHLRKIAESDAVVHVGSVQGYPYVGESTRRELLWAKVLGKEVYRAEWVPDGLRLRLESAKVLLSLRQHQPCPS